MLNFENDYLKPYNEFSNINMHISHKIRQRSTRRLLPWNFCFIGEPESLVLAYFKRGSPWYIAEVTQDSGSFRHLK